MSEVNRLSVGIRSARRPSTSPTQSAGCSGFAICTVELVPVANLAAARRYAALQSWATTVDRSARTARARRNGPAELDWHLERLDRMRFANATIEQQRAAAEAARRAYYARLAMKSAQARRRSVAS